MFGEGGVVVVCAAGGCCGGGDGLAAEGGVEHLFVVGEGDGDEEEHEDCGHENG